MTNNTVHNSSLYLCYVSNILIFIVSLSEIIIIIDNQSKYVDTYIVSTGIIGLLLSLSTCITYHLDLTPSEKIKLLQRFPLVKWLFSFAGLIIILVNIDKIEDYKEEHPYLYACYIMEFDIFWLGLLIILCKTVINCYTFIKEEREAISNINKKLGELHTSSLVRQHENYESLEVKEEN